MDVGVDGAVDEGELHEVGELEGCVVWVLETGCWDRF